MSRIGAAGRRGGGMGADGKGAVCGVGAVEGKDAGGYGMSSRMDDSRMGSAGANDGSCGGNVSSSASDGSCGGNVSSSASDGTSGGNVSSSASDGTSGGTAGGSASGRGLAARLPAELAQRLTGQLGAEGFRSFLACLDHEPALGLRLNTGKAPLSELTAFLPFALQPIPWADGGFFYAVEDRPGKTPYYQAGLFYLQEPSAMAPAAALDVRPGERVLDLCAAPGGKTTQLAAALGGSGLLVANDSSPKRIKPLVWNMEHWGVTNAVVLNEEAGRLAVAFPGFFDKILVDAPCSGEGMLRKDPAALRGWRTYGGQVCRDAQDGLLDHAASMLADGGRLVYSTCTFNPQENEEAVAAFLVRQPAFSLLPLPLYEGWKPGANLRDCRQLWPHLGKGEGQFMALLEKRGISEDVERVAATQRDKSPARSLTARTASGISDIAVVPSPPKDLMRKPAEDLAKKPGEELEAYHAFAQENFTYPLEGPFVTFSGHVYRVPADLPDLAGLRVARPGWYMGLVRNGRFVTGQPLAMGLKADQFQRRLDLDPDGEEVRRYLRGETLMLGGARGWTLVTMGGFPLGFGRQTGEYLKNAYASGWRTV